MTGQNTNEVYGSGTTPKKSDTIRMLLVKDVLATTAGGGGGGSSKVLSGNGAPSGGTAAANIIYVQLDSTPPGIMWYSDGVSWH